MSTATQPLYALRQRHRGIKCEVFEAYLKDQYLERVCFLYRHGESLNSEPELHGDFHSEDGIIILSRKRSGRYIRGL